MRAASAARCLLHARWRLPGAPLRRGVMASASAASSPLVRLQTPLRVAVLNSPGNDPYAPMFERFIGSALADPSLLKVTSFETEAGELPALGAFDGYVLSGSRHGAYEQLPWIAELLAWTRAAVAARERLLGVCFGHQIIAQALGGRVEPNGAGFEIGGVEMPLTPAARAYFDRLLRGAAGDDAATVDEAALPAAVRMLYVHGDAVLAMPPGFSSLGGSPLSAFNGMTDGRRVLTFQGHPEFDAATVERLLPVLDQRGLVPGRLPPGQDVRAVRASLTAQPLDTPLLARAVVGFLTAPLE